MEQLELNFCLDRYCHEKQESYGALGLEYLQVRQPRIYLSGCQRQWQT